MKKQLFALVAILTSQVMAVDFNKEISLGDCLSIPQCNQGVLSKGGWSSTDSGIRNSNIKKIKCEKRNGRANLGCMGLNIRCDKNAGCLIGCGDGLGCFTVYDQVCRDMDLDLQDKLKNFPYFEVWEKKTSYFETNLPKEIWNLIQLAAQFEIDCFEKKPSNAKGLGPQGGIYNHCPDLNHPTRNCNPVKGFTKMYSKEILAKAKNALYKKWDRIAKAQSNFNINKSPRNLFLLQGDFSSLDNASFDEYNAFVSKMESSKFLPNDLKKIVSKEKKLIAESKKYFEQECLFLEKASIEDLDVKTGLCTELSLTGQNYKNFTTKKEARLKTIEKEFWQQAVKQAEENPQDAIASNSLIDAYLTQYPKGDFVKQANELYEKTLAQEGLKEAKKDTLLGLSEKSLLKRYMMKYPHGKFAEHASTFLEKLLFSYSMSQIKNNTKDALRPNSHPEQYLSKYPNGKYRDSINIALEDANWKIYSQKCAENQTKASCEALFTFSAKFSSSIYLDSVRLLIDEPMWTSINVAECHFSENDECSEIEKYVATIPKGRYIKDAEKILEKAKNNSEKRDLEEQRKAEREERAMAWYEEYQNTTEGCSFNTKKDQYDYEWGEQSFPEKNGTIECVKRIDLTLDSLDTLNFKCIERQKIIVKGGKITKGDGFCVNANSDTLVRRSFSSSGKFKTTYYFPNKIIFSVGENGDYSIKSKELKLKDIYADKIITILSHAKTTSGLLYLYDVDNFEFDWTKSGQIKNIRITDYDNQKKVIGKLNIPLNAKGEKHGISEIYTASTNNFKIEWSNGKFKRIIGGGKKLKDSLCPKHVCANLIWQLQKSDIVYHNVPTMESSRDSGYQGFEEGWMLHYIAYLLGITINEGLEIWNSL
jgi:hypothetical protein